MDCSMPGFPVHHQLLKLAQTQVHWVSDAIQPSHPLLSPSSPTFKLPSIRVFSNESVLSIRWSKYWSCSFSISPSNEYSGLISFRTDWMDLLAVQGISRVFSNIHWIIEKARGFQKNIYFCFIDYPKAFDYVDHSKLWKILKEMGIPDHLTCLLRNLYTGQEAIVRTEHGTMDWFQTGKGVP